MPTLSAVAAKLLGQGLPVLLLDTCSMIDVARAPVRMTAKQMQDAHDLIEMASAKPPACAMVRASPIQVEYVNNIGSGEADTLKRLDLVSTSLDLLADVERWIAPTFPGYRKPDAGIAPYLLSLANRAKNACERLNRSSTTDGRAIRRVVSKVRPARLGKDSTNDCRIFEEYLELGRLIGSTHSFPVVMLSSNKDDFHFDEIEDELASVGIEFAKNWSHARRLLNL